MTRLLLFALAAMVLAGCTDAGPGGDTGGTIDQSPLTTEQGKDLLSRVEASPPEKFGLEATFSKDGKDTLTLEGAVDNASGIMLMTIKMDPSFLADAGGGFGEGMAESMAGAFADGLSFYVTKTSVVYMMNGTAFVFPPSESGQNSFTPTGEQNPFDDFLTDPTQLVGEGLDDNVTIESVTPTMFRGQAAVAIKGTTRQDEGAPANVTITVFREPARLAKIEADLPEDASDGTDPFSGGRLVMELYYDGDVKLDPSPAIARAAGLRYSSDAMTGGSDTITWTFQAASGIALTEVEAQVKDAGAMGSGDMGPTSLSSAPTLWSMSLSEGAMSKDGVTLTFTDADGDGKVSAGDTLQVVTSSDASGVPQVVLYDTVTGTYVVPAPALVLALLALAGVAALLRRRD